MVLIILQITTNGEKTKRDIKSRRVSKQHPPRVKSVGIYKIKKEGIPIRSHYAMRAERKWPFLLKPSRIAEWNSKGAFFPFFDLTRDEMNEEKKNKEAVIHPFPTYEKLKN